MYKSATTDTSGRVHIEGVVPGDYKAVAWEEIEPGSWQDTEVLRRYETSGKPMHFEESAQQGTTLYAPAQTPRY